MFFYASKILGFLALPTNVLLAVGCIGAVLMATRFARAGGRLLAACALLLAICGWSPLGNLLLRPLEERFPPAAEQGPEPHGIIVLGGAIEELISTSRDRVALSDAAERMTAAVMLARRYPAARLVFTGGSGLLFGGGVEAVYARRFFLEMGIAPERLAIEDSSRNTSENAILTKQLVQPKAGERWLLVTSAFHMPRAMGIFRKEDFPVEAYPVDWRTRGGSADLLGGFGRATEGLQRVDIALREWVGLAMYWLTGRSAALFPAP